jgi:hypothetical protein
MSFNVPMAMNCVVVPRAMLGAGGATFIDATSDVVSVVDPVMPPEAAVIMVEPVVEAAAVTRPCEAEELLMVAIPAFDESQTTAEVIYCLLLLEKVPIAVSRVVVPGAMTGLAGVTAIEVRVIGGPGIIPPPPPEHAASSVANKKISITKLDPCFMIVSLSELQDLKRNIPGSQD